MIFVPVRFIKASIFVGEKQEDIEEETQALIRKMNQYFEQQPSPASSSSQSKDAQETSSNSLSENKDVPLQNPIFPWFFPGLDLNPARMILAEMAGTFILMFAVCGIIASTQLMRGEVGLMEYAATGGLTIVVLVYCIGPISGAHVNPAVTIALAIFENFPWPRVPFYVCAQTVGSVLGTFVGKSVYNAKADIMTTHPLQGCSSAFWVELIATFIIVFLAAAMTKEAQFVGNLAGFVFGVAIGLAVLITGPISGGSMNPARSLGPAIISWNFKDIWIYVTAPVLGAIAGGFLHSCLRLRPWPRPPPTTSSPNTELLNHSLVFLSN